MPDDGAVVDEAGRVFGTAGLYVVDASIMPTVPSGFTHLPTIMIAERLSERIAAVD
jgi:choline dehydrogenase-like flavoprotein